MVTPLIRSPYFIRYQIISDRIWSPSFNEVRGGFVNRAVDDELRPRSMFPVSFTLTDQFPTQASRSLYGQFK